MTQQEEFLERYRDLRDWYHSIFTETRIASSGGGTLRVALPRNHAGNPLAVVVSGRTEFIEKYLEFARDLHHRGVSTVLYDHCGQGDSDRQLVDRQKGYIDSFQTYVEDLGKVIEITTNCVVFRLTAWVSSCMRIFSTSESFPP